jgi:hypothetical protein
MQQDAITCAKLHERMAVKQIALYTRNSNMSQGDDYLNENGHVTPKYEFIVSSGDTRMVDYVLRMDNLSSKFPALMKAYGLNASLPASKSNEARTSGDFEAAYFDETTKALIEEKYEDDVGLRQTTAK